MREIKYKCWDKENKRWLDINEIISDWGNTPWIDAMCVSGDTTFELNDSVNSLVWLQYTGLKDKNGKEIYEGDVVKISMGWEKNPDSLWDFVAPVIFQDCKFTIDRVNAKALRESAQWEKEYKHSQASSYGLQSIGIQKVITRLQAIQLKSSATSTRIQNYFNPESFATPL